VEIASYNPTNNPRYTVVSLVPNSDLEVCQFPIPDSPANAT